MGIEIRVWIGVVVDIGNVFREFFGSEMIDVLGVVFKSLFLSYLVNLLILFDFIVMFFIFLLGVGWL